MARALHSEGWATHNPIMANEPTESKKREAMFNLAFRGYNRDEVDMHFAHVEKETQHLLAQLADLRKSAEGAQLEAHTAGARDEECASQLEATEGALNQMIAEVERLKAECEGVKEQLASSKSRIAELETEESASREILRAAQKAAEEMRERGRLDAQARVLAAEEHAQTVEADARRKVKELEEGEAALRAQYERFLAEARALTGGFVRTIDEARDNL